MGKNTRGKNIHSRFKIRRFWQIKPFTRIKESKKIYNRKRQKVNYPSVYARGLNLIYFKKGEKKKYGFKE